MKPKILIVDDDPHICEIVQAYCEKEGMQAVCSFDGEDAYNKLVDFRPDLIVLDVLLGVEDGIAWGQSVRESNDVPILFLSSREEDEVKIRALSFGDDYVTKPFSPGVLVARIKAHLRRISAGRRDQLLELPGMTLDFAAQNVILGGRTIILSKKEFGILAYLAHNVNQPVSVDTLFQLIWGLDSLDDVRTVAVHISNLRKKMEDDPADPRWIVTVRGAGYMLAAET